MVGNVEFIVVNRHSFVRAALHERGKDEPVIFRRAMEHFGAQRGSTVVFEDAIHAIETAKKDGFTVAAVFDESEKRQDEVRALADCYITSFEHLEQFWAMTAAD